MPLWRGGPNTRTLPTVLFTPSASKATDMAHLCVPQNQVQGVCRGFVPDIQICDTHGRKNLANATIISNVKEEEEATSYICTCCFILSPPLSPPLSLLLSLSSVAVVIVIWYIFFFFLFLSFMFLAVLVWFGFGSCLAGLQMVCLLACLIGWLLYLTVCLPDWLFSLFLLFVCFLSFGLSLFQLVVVTLLVLPVYTCMSMCVFLGSLSLSLSSSLSVSHSHLSLPLALPPSFCVLSWFFVFFCFDFFMCFFFLVCLLDS